MVEEIEKASEILEETKVRAMPYERENSANKQKRAELLQKLRFAMIELSSNFSNRTNSKYRPTQKIGHQCLEEYGYHLLDATYEAQKPFI